MPDVPSESESDRSHQSIPRATIPPLARPFPHDQAMPDSPRIVARRVQYLPMPMSRIRALAELFLVALAFVVGVITTGLVMRGWPELDERWLNVGSTAGGGVGALLTCALLLRVAGHTPLTIGWTRAQILNNVSIGLGALVLTYVALFIVAMTSVIFYPEILQKTPQAQKAFQEAFPPTSLSTLVLMMVFVAIWEEVVFRGFALTRLQAIFKRWWLAIAVSAAFFGVLHHYEGVIGMAVIAGLAFVMGVLFAWRKSLVPSIVFHLVNNVVFVLLIRLSELT